MAAMLATQDVGTGIDTYWRNMLEYNLLRHIDRICMNNMDIIYIYTYLIHDMGMYIIYIYIIYLRLNLSIMWGQI